MMKKHFLIAVLVALLMIFSACSPSEPPLESTPESSTPIEAPDESSEEAPTENRPKEYDFGKIEFFTAGVMNMGEIRDFEEYKTKISALIEACVNYEEREGDPNPSVTWVYSFLIDVTFKTGCDISDDELTAAGLGLFKRIETDDGSNGVSFEKEKAYATAEFFDAVLELSQNENVEHVKVDIVYLHVVAD